MLNMTGRLYRNMTVLPSCRAGTHCGDMRSTRSTSRVREEWGDATTCASVRHPSVSMTKWTTTVPSILLSYAAVGYSRLDMTQERKAIRPPPMKSAGWLSPAAKTASFGRMALRNETGNVTVTATGSPPFLPGSQRGDRCRAATASAARAASSYAVASMPSRLPSGSTVKRTVTSPCRPFSKPVVGYVIFSASHCSSAACPSAANRGGSS